VCSSDLYSLASSLTQKAFSVIQILTGPLFPAMAGLDARSETGRVRRAYGLSTRAAALVCFCLFVPLAAGGKSFISAWIDPLAGERCGRAFALLAFGGFFGGLNAVSYSTLMGLGYARMCSLTSVAGGLVSLAMMAVTVPRLGLTGAALGAFSGYGSLYFMRLILIERRVFEASIVPRLAESLLFLLGSLAAYLAVDEFYLRAGALRLVPVMASLAGFSAVFFALGLKLDALIAARRGRDSVYAALRAGARR
jgi:O-antigen/teichoic acid export membrane protein